MAKRTSGPRLVFEFPDDETRMSFVGWYLDGGGEYTWGEGREERGEPWMRNQPPDGRRRWDWQTKPGADEYVIRLVAPKPDSPLNASPGVLAGENFRT